MKAHESDELSVQISAYIDNEFDVAVLMEEADTKAAAVEQVHDLEEELGRVNELLQELEVEAMASQVDLENQLEDVKRERDSLLEKSQQVRRFDWPGNLSKFVKRNVKRAFFYTFTIFLFFCSFFLLT